MTISLLLAGLALLLRGEAALLNRRESPLILHLLSWLLGMMATWLAVIALGAWASWWPVLLVALIGTAATDQWQNNTGKWAIRPAADGLLVLLTGLISLPPLNWQLLLPAAVLLPILGFLLDQLTTAMTRHIPWGWLAAAGLVPMLLLIVIPATQDTAGRVLATRFIYLLPDTTAVPAPPPQVTDAVTGPTPTTPSITPLSPTATPPVIVTPTTNANLNAQGTQWVPYIEWQLPYPDYHDNPFDLVASATFTHSESGETRTTGLFFRGDDIWAFRFSGTQLGEWTFRTSSAEPLLDGLQGTVWIEPNPGAAGFVIQYGNKWGRSGLNRAFVPQYVMIDDPSAYYNNPAKTTDMIDTFLVKHGFNGVHTPVFCRWFDIEQRQCGRINVADPNPDPRTFEALEDLIREVHAAGGVVHIWMWGDDSRSENPKRWGLNGTADRRLQRYIAARLGPLPGWTMGYGYDLWEWVSGDELTAWHAFMHEQMGWSHYLGARSSKNALDQLSEAMDYAAYEQHRPDYDLYVQTIETRPEKPAFSEDRFRIREPTLEKDYTMELTRRGLWHSAMAGGVANIWGNLIDPMGGSRILEASAPYPNPEMIKTYSLFFEDRFWADMVRCNHLTDGVCLMRPNSQHYIFYIEDTDRMIIDLSGMNGRQTAVAVDTRLPYHEIDLGVLSPLEQTWIAPYVSDWAVAIGISSQNRE
jgi:hypothetical protein